MPQGQTFENASSFIAAYFSSYPTTVVIGYLIYDGRYVPVGKSYGGTTTVMPFGSRANCPTQVPSYGPVSPAEYDCTGFDKIQKYHDGNGGFTWVSVENPSAYCGYVYRPSAELTFDYGQNDACNGTVFTTYYLGANDGTFKMAEELWIYSDGTGSAPAGYYSDGTWVRYWGGNGFSGTAAKCTSGNNEL
jgi:hypothetical protein